MFIHASGTHTRKPFTCTICADTASNACMHACACCRTPGRTASAETTHDEQLSLIDARASLAAAKEQAALDNVEVVNTPAAASAAIIAPAPTVTKPAKQERAPVVGAKKHRSAAAKGISIQVAAPTDEVTVQIFKRKEDSMGLGVTHTSSGSYVTLIKRDGPCYMPFLKKHLKLDAGLRFKTVNGKDVTASKADVVAAFKTAGDAAKIVFHKDPVRYAEAAAQAEADKSRAKAAAAERARKSKDAHESHGAHRKQPLQGDARKAGVVATAAAKRSKSPNPAARRAKSPAPKAAAPPQEAKEASDWATAVDPTSGKTYHYNRKTNVTSWTPPDLTPEPAPEPSLGNMLDVPMPGAGSSPARIRTPKGRGPSRSPAPSPANSHGDFTVVIKKEGPVGLLLSEQTPGDGVYVTGVTPAGAAAAVFAKKHIDIDAGLKVTKVDGKPSPTKKDVIALFKASRSAVKIQFSLDPEGYAAVATTAPAPMGATTPSVEASEDSAAKAKNIKSKRATSSPRAASPSKGNKDAVTIVIHKGAHPLGLTLLEGAASKGCYVGAVTKYGAAEPVLAKKKCGVDDGLRFAKINDKEASTKQEVAGLLKAAGAVVKLEFALDPKGYRAAVAEAPPASPTKERKAMSAPSGDDGRKVKSPVRAKAGAAMSKLDEVVVIVHKGSLPLGITVVEPQPGKGAWLDKVKATDAAAPVFKKKNLSPATGLRFKTVNGKACSTQKEVGAALKLAGTTVKLVFIKDPAGHAAATPPHDAADPLPESSLGKEGRTSPERAVVTDASDVMPGASVDGLSTSDALANIRDDIGDIERRISRAAHSNDALTQMRRRLSLSDADGAADTSVEDAQRAEEKAVLERHARLEKHAKAGLIVKTQWLNAEARVLKRLHAEHSGKMTHAFANLVLDFKDVLMNLRHVAYVDEHRPTWEFHHQAREVRPVRKFSVYNAQQV